MATLAIKQTTAKQTVGTEGQVTLPEALLHHLGIEPGGEIELYPLPGGQVQIRRARTGKIQDFFGILAGKTDKVLTIEEINELSGPGPEDAW